MEINHDIPPNVVTAVAGVRPTSAGAHLGHYVGNIKPLLRHRGIEHRVFVIADLNVARNEVRGFSSHATDLIALASDLIAAGLDPNDVPIVPQSRIRSNLLPFFCALCSQASFARVARLPAIKAMLRTTSSEIHFDDLIFPFIQATDLLSLRAGVVFANADNRPMVEFTRELARRLNRLSGSRFPEPRLVLGDLPWVPGTDGRKMSKAKGNCIFLSDDPHVIRAKVMSMFTDPNRVHSDTPGDPLTNPVFSLHRLFNDDTNEVENLGERYRQGQVGDVEVKERLALALERFLHPIRSKRAELLRDVSQVEAALQRGAAFADRVIAHTLAAIDADRACKHYMESGS